MNDCPKGWGVGSAVPLEREAKDHWGRILGSLYLRGLAGAEVEVRGWVSFPPGSS